MSDENALFSFRHIHCFFTKVCTGIMMSKQHGNHLKQKRVLIVKKAVWQLLARMVHTGDQNVARFCSTWLAPLQDALLDTQQHTSHTPQSTVMAVVWVCSCASACCTVVRDASLGILSRTSPLIHCNRKIQDLSLVRLQYTLQNCVYWKHLCA